MAVVFLTSPAVTPLDAMPELAAVQADQRADLLVASVPTAKAFFTVVERLEALGCSVRQSRRGPAEPLVALWVADAHENPEPLAPIADLVLLGGGWVLLQNVLDELEATRGVARMSRLERLGRLPGVYVPGLFTVEYGEDGAIASVLPSPSFALPVGLGGSAPFSKDAPPSPPLHPRPALAQLLGSVGLEGEAEKVRQGERVHLRFAVGLTHDEPSAIAAWVKRLRHLLVTRWKDERRIPPMSVSLSCFVPRPWTPLQWWPMLTEEALKARLAAISRELSKIAGATVTRDLPKWALLEGILARGDRRAGELLLAASRVGWDRARLVHPLNPAFALHRERGREEQLPWDHLCWGIDRDALWAQYQQAWA
jgi:hypothetical protein